MNIWVGFGRVFTICRWVSYILANPPLQHLGFRRRGRVYEIAGFGQLWLVNPLLRRLGRSHFLDWRTQSRSRYWQLDLSKLDWNSLSPTPCGVNLSGANISVVKWVVGSEILFVCWITHCVNLCKGLLWKLGKMGMINVGSYCRAVTTCNTISETIQEGTNV